MQRNYSVIRWAVALTIIASVWGATSRLKTPLSLVGMPTGERLRAAHRQRRRCGCPSHAEASSSSCQPTSDRG